MTTGCVVRIAAAAGAVGLVRWLWVRQTVRAARAAPPGLRTEDGVLLHTETCGLAHADVSVLFAHGFAAQLEVFDEQRAALSPRARLIFFDQRGHGRSGWSGPQSATIERLARDLGRVIDAYADDRPVVLVGHSLGGFAVLALAQERADLFGHPVAGVALISTSAGRLAEARMPRRVASMALRSGMAQACLWGVWLGAPLLDLLRLTRSSRVRQWLRYRLFGRKVPRRAVVSKMLAMWAQMPQSIAAAFYPAIAAYDAGRSLDVCEAFPYSCSPAQTTALSRRTTASASQTSSVRGHSSW